MHKLHVLKNVNEAARIEIFYLCLLNDDAYWFNKGIQLAKVDQKP
jgi:hypothetical protein